jgi:CheY-like chemotaxis protein
MPLKSKFTCPFVDAGIEECFVTSLTSAKIEGAITYCGGNYTLCKIYRKHVSGAREARDYGGNGVSRILVVVDDADFLVSLRFALCGAGYYVSTAKNGVEGLTRILLAQMMGESIDLLITDVQVPEISMLTLIRQVKSHGIPIPVMAITSGFDKELFKELESLGCREIIDKPFTPKELMRRIGRVLPPADSKAG